MSDYLGENLASPREERQKEGASEISPDTFGTIFGQIEMSIAEGRASEKKLTSLTECLVAGDTEGRSVEEATKLVERVDVIRERWNFATKRFQEKIQKALLPAMSVLAMASAPALAEESQTERIVTTPEVSMKVGAGELMPGQVFDFNSPLYVVGEKMKKIKREMLPEELILVEDFSQKAKNETNEWVVVSGKDKGGKFTSTIRGGSQGSVIVPVEFYDSLRSKTFVSIMHTHPPETINEDVDQSDRKNSSRFLIAPPSATDIVMCKQEVHAQNQLIHRVVDSNGVWEYACERGLTKAQIDLIRSVRQNMEMIVQKYGLQDKERIVLNQAFGIVLNKSINDEEVLKTSEDTLEYISFLSTLDIGVSNDISAVLGAYAKEQRAILKNVFGISLWGGRVAEESPEHSPKRVSVKIADYIKYVEGLGVAMSYTPFRGPAQEDSISKIDY